MYHFRVSIKIYKENKNRFDIRENGDNEHARNPKSIRTTFT